MTLNLEKRNPDGTWKKGISGNPSGKPNRSAFMKLLRETFGDDSRELIYLLSCQLYGIEPDLGTHVVRDKLAEIVDKSDFRTKKKKYKYKKDWRLISDNVWKLIDHMQGKALTNISAELDNKVTKVTVDLPDNLNEEDF